MAKNVAVKVQGNKLTVEIDLKKSQGPSRSGKTEIIGTTSGNVSVEGHEGVCLGVNCYNMNQKKCADCGKRLPKPPHTGPTGYAVVTATGKHICYACGAKRSMIELRASGHSKILPLCLTISHEVPIEVSNWPGTLRFKVLEFHRGRHNIAGTRIDVRFNGPDGHRWHGVQYGEWTQIVHCRRLKIRGG